MRHDPHVAAFVPPSLASAAPELLLFIVFLYRQATGLSDLRQRGLPWLVEWHRAVAALRESEGGDSGTTRPGGLF